jgi:hypothetical protein
MKKEKQGGDKFIKAYLRLVIEPDEKRSKTLLSS